MASADPHDVPGAGSSQDPDFTLQDMRRLQAKFAEDAMHFLLTNTEKWNSEEETLPIFDNSGPCVTFTDEVGKALITIAYIQRIGYRKKFRTIFDRLYAREDFEKHIMNYPVDKTETYFYNFLGWVAYTFDFTVYFLKKGFDFTDEATECIARYPDLLYFHSRGGWGQLLEYSTFLAALYDQLDTVISQELPSDNNLLPFMQAIEYLMRDEITHGPNCDRTPEVRQLREIRKRLLYKYEVLSSIDPRRIARGFNVRMKKSPIKPKPIAELHAGAAEMLAKYRRKPKPERDEVDDLVEAMEQTRIKVELTDRTPGSKKEASHLGPGEIVEPKSVFIVNGRFLEKRLNQKQSSKYKKKRGLKVYSPSKQTEKLAINLNDILDENIANKNYKKIDEDLYAVCPPGCDINDKDIRLIILETSSEEEEDYVTLKKVEKGIMAIVRRSKERQNRNEISEHCTKGVQSAVPVSSLPEKESNLPQVNTGAISKHIVRDPPTEAETVKHLPSAIAVSSLLEKESNLPQVNTGAISKHIVRDPPTEAETVKHLPSAVPVSSLPEKESNLPKVNTGAISKHIVRDPQQLLLLLGHLPKVTQTTQSEVSNPINPDQTPIKSPKKKSHRRKKKSKK